MVFKIERASGGEGPPCDGARVDGEWTWYGAGTWGPRWVIDIADIGALVSLSTTLGKSVIVETTPPPNYIERDTSEGAVAMLTIYDDYIE